MGLKHRAGSLWARFALPPPHRSQRSLMRTLYQPLAPDGSCGRVVDIRVSTREGGRDQGIALPPPELSLGYVGDTSSYLASGHRCASALREVMTGSGVDPAAAAVLDWGCATGRVLRHFSAEAATGAYWGVDQSEPCIEWAKRELSPPFKFATCSTLAHLPFASGAFDFVYALSVFTHLEVLRDAWLLELRRLLRLGGVLAVTVWDDDAVPGFKEHGLPEWWPAGVSPDALATTTGLCAIVGETWSSTHVFYSRRYIEETWSRYFDILDFVPRFYTETEQTLVVLRKAGEA